MSDAASFQPDVFHGELTANRAQVFVRVARSPELAGCTLRGYVHGPTCEYAQTLPARFVLQDLGPGPTLLARATITDPCLWTSDLPQLYTVHIELARSGQTVATEVRQFGLRGLGVKTTRDGARLAREGKVWIPRGVCLNSLNDAELASLREQLLVGIYRGLPPLDWLQTASRRGLYGIIDLRAAQGDMAQTLVNLARWPAVMLVILGDVPEQSAELRQRAPNLLLAQGASLKTIALIEPAAWAHAVVLELAGDLTRAARSAALRHAASLSQPVLLAGPLGQAVELKEARSKCDRMQAEAAPDGQFAGYLVYGS